MDKENFSHWFFTVSTLFISLILSFSFLFVITDKHLNIFTLTILVTIIAVYSIFIFLPQVKISKNKYIKCFRLLPVPMFSIIASIFIGFLIIFKIKDYYDAKGALSPEWLNLVGPVIFYGCILGGLVIGGILFNKYYENMNKENAQDAVGPPDCDA